MATTNQAADAIEVGDSHALGRMKAIASSWADLVFYLPRKYKDYSAFAPGFVGAYKAMRGEGKSCLRVVVQSKTGYDRSGNQIQSWDRTFPARLSLRASDATGTEGWITIFGNTYPWKNVVAGAEICTFGTVVSWNGKWQIKNAELIAESDQGRLVPVYPQKPGYLTSVTIAKGVMYALDRYLSDAIALVSDSARMPETVLDKLVGGADGVRGALISVHKPGSLDAAHSAQKTLRKLAALQIVAQASEVQGRTDEPASVISIEGTQIRSLADALPITLTGDQRKVINEVVLDMRASRAMRRLLTGDVGCGKSICFIIPAVAIQKIGRKAAILAPNQLIAEQICRQIAGYYPGTPVAIVTAERKPSAEVMLSNPILVGTTALVNWAKRTGFVPDYLVVDEQHKHSRDIRESLVASHTNLLEATATPIPRSLALVTHGGLDVSTLKESPVIKSIETRIVDGIEEARLEDFVRRAIDGNWQVAVVYGRVEDDENSDVRSIEAELKAWEKRFPGKVGVIHGRLNEDDKQAVVARMLNKEISLLVSSTVIELGLTLPSLRAMVVVNAEMFGLSTLHQLRGRVARDGGRGKFLMFLPKDVGEDARKRLNVLPETNDGFRIAEMDMEMRGFGDLSAVSEDQTGDSQTLFRGLVVTPTDLEEAAALFPRSNIPA